MHDIINQSIVQEFHEIIISFNKPIYSRIVEKLKAKPQVFNLVPYTTQHKHTKNAIGTFTTRRKKKIYFSFTSIWKFLNYLPTLLIYFCFNSDQTLALHIHTTSKVFFNRIASLDSNSLTTPHKCIHSKTVIPLMRQ